MTHKRHKLASVQHLMKTLVVVVCLHVVFPLICHPSADQQPSSVHLLLFDWVQFGSRPSQFKFLIGWYDKSYTQQNSSIGVQMVLLCTSDR